MPWTVGQVLCSIVCSVSRIPKCLVPFARPVQNIFVYLYTLVKCGHASMGGTDNMSVLTTCACCAELTAGVCGEGTARGERYKEMESEREREKQIERERDRKK